MDELKKTTLYDEHINLGAKMVPFGGWLMPVQYEGIIKEHNMTRNFSGLFDVSHMGQIFIKGKDAVNFLNSIVAQKIDELKEGHAKYCHLPNKEGGVIDDLIIYNTKNIIKNADYLIIANASRIDADFSFIKKEKERFDISIINRSDDYSMLALQGRNAKFIVDKMGLNLSSQPEFFTILNTKLNDIPLLLTRTGYTGEDGFELIFENKYAKFLWNKILSYKDEFNVSPVGLGARDTLRLEAGLPLWGHELNEDTTPVESSLGFFIPEDKKEDYNGKELIIGQKTKTLPLRKKLFPFIMKDRTIARADYEVYIDNKKIGTVTSGAPSPTLGKNIGFCMIDFNALDKNLVSKLNNPKESIGMIIQVMVRNKLYDAEIVKKPFVEKRYVK